MTHIAGIYLFPEVENLDFAGPFEVFFTAARMYRRGHPEEELLFQPLLIAENPGPVAARGNVRVLPHHTFQDHPPLDILLVPGGVVSEIMENSGALEWIRRESARATYTVSVCTGAFLLGAAGLLKDKRAVTHWEDMEDLGKLFPHLHLAREARWVDEGKVITAAGISAGIDVALHLVERIGGEELALRTARQMEYRWNRE
ncbi:MAG TPA: DJ-1/PfpI family protein [Synergistaceae bacterium]|nr:DJ-1/PfpI family protein [Synergistaceae bacterium]HPQ38186.1 DJ-1/PfpI family protein [Synergistaceae bacterium]